jgi:ribonuclease D
LNPLIDSPSQLDVLVKELENEPDLAVDTEADSLHCYFEKLCLIQISTGDGRHFLVDPLSKAPLQALLDSLQSKTVIFHAADFDLRMLRSAGEFAPGMMFDTSIAARLLGFRELGLAAITQSLIGITLVKHSQRENWALRPLPQKMVDYAINDTRHLHAIRNILEPRLREKNRYGWMIECCERMVQGAMQDRARDEENAWRITGHAKLSPQGCAILRELWQWRDESARKRDRPAFHILRNEDLLRAAETFERGERFESTQLRGDARGMFNEIGRRAAELPAESWPERIRRPRPKPFTEEQENRLEHLRKVREVRATELELDPSIIAPRAAIERIAADPAHASTSLMRWQRELLGIANDGSVSA